jgi:hypothetical protein
VQRWAAASCGHVVIGCYTVTVTAAGCVVVD